MIANCLERPAKDITEDIIYLILDHGNNEAMECLIHDLLDCYSNNISSLGLVLRCSSFFYECEVVDECEVVYECEWFIVEELPGILKAVTSFGSTNPEVRIS